MLNQQDIFKLLFTSSPEIENEWMIVQNKYSNYQEERIDYVDIYEPLEAIVKLFKDGNQIPIKELFKVIEAYYDQCDSSARDFLQAGIIETLDTVSDDLDLDVPACYKMLMNQRVIKLWKNLDQIS